MIGEMRNHIIINQYTTTESDSGGTSSVLSATHNLWAKVENRSGSIQTGNGQIQWQYDYKITIRFDRLKAIKQNDEVVYDGKKLLIQSVQNIDEGKKFYLVLRCSTID